MSCRAFSLLYFLQILTAPDLQTHEFVSLAFSPDTKYLIAQGGKSDWTLVYWAWEKAKIMATMKTSNQTGQPVYQVRDWLILIAVASKKTSEFHLNGRCNEN